MRLHFLIFFLGILCVAGISFSTQLIEPETIDLVHTIDNTIVAMEYNVLQDREDDSFLSFDGSDYYLRVIFPAPVLVSECEIVWNDGDTPDSSRFLQSGEIIFTSPGPAHPRFTKRYPAGGSRAGEPVVYSLYGKVPVLSLCIEVSPGPDTGPVSISGLFFYGREIPRRQPGQLSYAVKADPGDSFFLDDESEGETGCSYSFATDGWEQVFEISAYNGAYSRTLNEYAEYYYAPWLLYGRYNVYCNWPAIDTSTLNDSVYIIFVDVGSHIGSTELYYVEESQPGLCGTRTYVGEYIFNPSALPWIKICLSTYEEEKYLIADMMEFELVEELPTGNVIILDNNNTYNDGLGTADFQGTWTETTPEYDRYANRQYFM
jgi:hypothetical protein